MSKFVKNFFWFISERWKIYLRKEVEEQSHPWTDNYALQNYMFCNVFRELDKGTLHVIDHILPIEDRDQMLFNMVLYRFLNKPRSYSLIEDYLDPFQPDHICEILRDRTAFNVAYRTRGPHGYDSKLESIIYGVFDEYLTEKIGDISTQLTESKSADEAVNQLERIPYVGSFLSLQIYLDLTYLDEFPYDENDYLYVGPGARKGIRMMFDDRKMSYEWYIHYLKSHQHRLFDEYGYERPDMSYKVQDYDELTLNDMQFIMCEWRKYRQVLNDEGRVRRYKHD